MHHNPLFMRNPSPLCSCMISTEVGLFSYIAHIYMYKVIEDMISVKTLLREALIEAEFDTGGHTIERIKERLI